MDVGGKREEGEKRCPCRGLGVLMQKRARRSEKVRGKDREEGRRVLVFCFSVLVPLLLISCSVPICLSLHSGRISPSMLPLCH